jgi:4,5-dihydroxyphthalate decarboxylase
MPSNRDLFSALDDGTVDAILFGGKREPDARFVTVLPDPAIAAQAWIDRNGATPINHMVVIREELATERPELVRAIYSALVKSRIAAEGDLSPQRRDPQPYGFEAVRPGLEIGVRYAVAQGLITEPLSMHRLYGPVRQALAEIAR